MQDAEAVTKAVHTKCTGLIGTCALADPPLREGGSVSQATPKVSEEFNLNPANDVY